MKTDSATPPGRFGAVWKDWPGSSEKTLRFRQSFQSARPMSGRPCGPSRSRVKSMHRRRWSWSGVHVIPGHGLVQDRDVAGLLDVGHDGEHEPRRIVVKPAADVVVPALREWLVLVIGAAIRELRRGDVEDPRPGALGDHVDEAEQVLVRVPETHASTDAGLEHGRRTRQVEGHHALVGVPGVDHPIDVRVAGRHLERREPLRPGRPNGREVLVGPPGLPVPIDQRSSPRRVRPT